MENPKQKRERPNKKEEGENVGGEKKIKLEATTTLLRAAETAAEDDRQEFVTLVKKLGCGKRKVQDLLMKGELWSGLKEDVKEDQNKKRTLDSFFDYCNRESKAASPISEQSAGSSNSAESPVQLPTPKKNYFPKKYLLLNQAYALVDGDSITFPDFAELEQTIFVDEKKSVGSFPRKVDVVNKVDFRLPHSNPLLNGEKHPLKLMRDDVLGMKEFHLTLLIGSSGCGKTTTAFLVGEKHFTLFMEIFVEGDTWRPYSVRETQFSRNRSNKKPSFDDIKRRALREIVARAILLAISYQHSNGTLTPYQWLLYSLSPKFVSLVDELKGGLSDKESTKILEQVSELVGQKVAVVIDEAHLLCGAKDYTFKEGNPKVNALSALVCGVLGSGAANWIHSLILLGTQMSLENGARVASSVFKSNDATPVVVLCNFPFLEAWQKSDNDEDNTFSVEGALLKCFEENFIRKDESLFRDMCLRFQGRPRVASEFIALCLNDTSQDFNVKRAFETYDSPGIKWEIARVRKEPNSKLDLSYLYELWYRSLIGEAKFPLGEYGTLVFTERVDMEGFRKFGKTGVSLTRARGEKVKFVHRLEEPILIEGIISYLQSESERSSPFQRLYDHVSKYVVAMTYSSVRGTYLDALVLLRVLTESCNEGLCLGKFFQYGIPEKDAKFCVKRIVSGVGMLNAWAKMIVENPDLEVMPGIKARHVAVLPETNAGADGVFAAFNQDGSVVFVSVVCAWYEDGVTAKKVADQLSKSDLSKQFQAAKGTGILMKRRKELANLAQNQKQVRVSVELPSRKGSDALQIDQEVFIIDSHNVKMVLGFEPLKDSRKDQTACRHPCKDKNSCKHACCKR